jgi:predicted nucleic acid-binding protein
MNRLFVDTGGLVARVLPRDQYHSASLKGWGILEQVNTHLFSSEHVLDESISLLARHASAS